MNFSTTDYNDLLTAVNQAQDAYITDSEPEDIFQGLLDSLLNITESEFGFVARIVRHNEDLFHLKRQASNIPFEKDFDTYNASLGEDTNAQKGGFKYLLHALVRTTEPVLFSAPADQSGSSKNTAVKHRVDSFMGIPLFAHGHLSGVICLFNRPAGYDPAWLEFLQPISRAYLHLSQALESDRLQVKIVAETRKQQELKYQALFQSSPDAIITVTMNEYLDGNQAALDMFGLETVDELRAIKLEGLSPEVQPDGRDFREVAVEMTERCKLEGPVKYEWTYRRRNGEIFPGELAVGYIPTLDGEDQFQLVIRDQSKVKEQERRLRQQDRLRQEMLNSSPVGIVISKLETGDMVFANQAAHEMLVVGHGEIVQGEKKQYWLDSSDRQYFKESLLQTGRAQREVKFLTKLGKEIACLLTWQWNPGTTDEVLAWLVDISHIKAIENNLLLQQTLQKHILDQLPVAVFSKDIHNDFRYSFCNQTCSKLLFTDADRWIGKTDFDFLPREFAEQIRQSDLEAVETGGPVFSSTEYRDPSGTESVLLSTRRIAIPDENGNPYMLLGISEDITERREAELAIQASERRFRELAEHAPVGIFLTDVKGACLFVNALWQKMTGLGQEQAAGSGWMGAIYEEDRPQLMDTWNDFVQGLVPFDVEYRLMRQDGHITWVQGSAVPFRNESGQSLGFLGACSDITQAKKQAVELAASRDEAHRANQAKSEFLSRMSHELRTPLNAILGFGQLLQLSGDNLTSSQNEGVDHILNAGELLLNLIEDVLDLSRIDTGHVSLKIQVANIENIFANSLALVKSQAKQAGIEIQVRTGDASDVIADPRRLQQVMVNLLTNAVKYNKPGGKVKLFCERGENDWVRIVVQDNGTGIHPSDQPRIWQPFERILNPDTEIEGTGIGLSISRKLVEMMGGTVGFRSELNQGSMFWLELPDTEPDSAFDEQIGGALTQQLTKLKDLRIAYIEDDLASMEFISETICRLENCELQTAYNGVDGVALVKSSQPDLVLMDLNLPGMAGWEALDLLKQDARTQNIPVIALSASASSNTRERAIQAGFSAFLPKPIRLGELFEAMLAESTRPAI